MDPKQFDHIFEALAQPFDPAEVKHRSQGGRQLSYITPRTARKRLNEVLGGAGWECRVEATEHWVKCSITVHLPEGPSITREALGGYPSMPQEEDKVKGGDCLPLDAQALTRKGWRFHHQLAIGDEVLGYDTESRTCKWTPVRHITVFDEPCPVVELRSKSFRMVCTQNHKWVVNRRNKGVLIKKTSELNYHDCIINAAPAEGGNHPLTPRESAILGWIATDGCVGTYDRRSEDRAGSYLRVVISQSKDDHREQIRTLLGSDATEITTPPGHRLFPGHAVASATMERSTFRLRNPFARALLAKAGINDWHDLTPLVLALSTESRAAMFKAMLDGDGHHSCSGQVLFGKKRKPGVMEAFEVLATLQGVALGTPQLKPEGNLTVRTLRRLPHVWAKCLTVESAPPVPVWCPTTGLGTWVTRWRTTITVTGNSDAFKRAAALWGIGEYLYGDEGAFVDRQSEAAAVHPTLRPASELPRRDPGPSSHGDRPPTSGKALFAWSMKVKENTGKDMVKYLQVWGKRQHFPDRLTEWSADEVAAGHAEAVVKLQEAEGAVPSLAH